MSKFIMFIATLRSDARGVTALEYGLIAAIIGGVIITASATLGSGITNVFGDIATRLTNAIP